MDDKPYRHHFPIHIIQQAFRLFHRFTLSYRDTQELLFKRSINGIATVFRNFNTLR